MSQESPRRLRSDEKDRLAPSLSIGTQTKSPTLDHVPGKTPLQKRDHSNEPAIPHVGETSGTRPTDPYTQSIPFGTDVANSRSVSSKVSESLMAAHVISGVEEKPPSSITTGIQEDRMQITPRHHRRLRGGIKATAMDVAQAIVEHESIVNVTESSCLSLFIHLTTSRSQSLALERPKSSHERYSSGGRVLPSELDLLARRSRSSLQDTDSKTMSVEVMSITGTTASTLPQDQAIFHDTEILAIVHRSKSSSTGLVSTVVWGWEGKRATLGEREQRKLQELGNRYGTSTVRPALIISIHDINLISRPEYYPSRFRAVRIGPCPWR